MEPWFHRGRVETLDANSCLGSTILSVSTVWPHEVEPWFHSWYRGRVETLDANLCLGSTLLPVSVST